MRPPRIPSFSYQGLHQYLLTLCTVGRRSVFTTEHIVAPVLAQFRRSAKAHDCAVVAYCFMPDHLHLLCCGQSEVADLRRFVTDAKQRTGYWYAKVIGGRLWQRGYYDHVLRKEEQMLPVVRYILTNPLRAGLSAALGEYPFCGCDVFSLGEIQQSAEMWTPARWRARSGG